MKLPCQSSYHPFKQKTYNYDAAMQSNTTSTKYCTSCMSIRLFVTTVLRAAFVPRQSLYGNAMIQMDRETAHAIVDEIFEDYESKH